MKSPVLTVPNRVPAHLIPEVIDTDHHRDLHTAAEINTNPEIAPAQDQDHTRAPQTHANDHPTLNPDQRETRSVIFVRRKVISKKIVNSTSIKKVKESELPNLANQTNPPQPTSFGVGINKSSTSNISYTDQNSDPVNELGVNPFTSHKSSFRDSVMKSPGLWSRILHECTHMFSVAF